MTDPALWMMGAGTATPAQPIGLITVDPSSPYLLRDGALWFYRGLTGFLLPKLVLQGNLTQARAYLAFAVESECNVVREFSQVDWTGPPGKGVEPGFLSWDYPRQDYDDALHESLRLAAEYGLHVEMVAHTFNYSEEQGGLGEMIAHSQRVDGIVSQHANGFFSDANEPPVNRIPIDAICAAFTPKTRIATSGQYFETPYPGRNGYADDHPPRNDQSCRTFKGAWEAFEGDGPYVKFQPAWKKPWVFGEPGRIEDLSCWPSLDDLESWGAGEKFFGAGATIHGGQWAQGCHVEMVTSDIRARIAAANRGWSAVPTQRYFDYQHPDDQGSLRRYRRRGEDGRWYEISVRPFGFSVV